MGKVVTFYTQLNERWPSDLVQALDTVVKVVQSWLDAALLGPVPATA
jgi:hypothetical protein